jgi:signal transduction histidine kinase
MDQLESVPVVAVSQPLAAGLVAGIEGDTVLELTVSSPAAFHAEAILRPLDLTSALCLALWRGQDLIGVQVCGYRGQGRATDAQFRIARGIAQLGSLALANVMTLEELKQANRLKDDFLATMSHELRTPLQSIMGYTELALESAFDPLTAKQSTALQKVKKAANRELKLINAMLQVSQLGTGRLPMVRAAVDVAALLEDLREETIQLRIKPTVGVEWRIPPALPQLYTDRTKLRIVLENLLSNAVKFTEQGSVIVDVYPSDGGMVFCVVDTGIGIAPAVQRVMFEMFRQGDGSSTRRYEGVGLGLYVVQRMLDILEGTVAVESEMGRGSTFRVWVPTLDAQPHAAPCDR